MDARCLRTLAVAVVACGYAEAVTVEAGLPGHKHVHGEVDPDEYLWSKLPGRCCFEMHEECPTPTTPRALCTRTSPDTCRACSVWSTPENYCHTSRENCLTCGMNLYCASPPPLLEGNKVCTGESYVGQGCYDDMATGMCASHTEGDCEAACREDTQCELFVYFPEEMKGSCVLCADLFQFEPTPDAATRAYAVSAKRAPPLPPGATAPSQFSVVPDPMPAAPPPAAVPPASSPPIMSSLGRHKQGKSNAHVDCTFVDGVEYTSTKQQGYSDQIAKTKEECCEMCGHHEAGCSKFVFEPGSGVCVLLPPLDSPSELETDDNQFVVSGTASVGAVATGADKFAVSECSYTASAGFTSGSIGKARPLPGGLMHSSEDCCRSCGVTPDCAKFTFSPGTKQCTMYASFAEIFHVDDLTAGVIRSKMSGATFNSAGFAGATGADGEPIISFLPPSPALPTFAQLLNLPPPGPPSRRESSTTTLLIRDASIGVACAIGLGFLLSLYCFFSPQILTAIHTVTGGRAGKVHVRSHRVSRFDEDEEWDRRKGRRSRNGHDRRGHDRRDGRRDDRGDDRREDRRQDDRRPDRRDDRQSNRRRDRRNERREESPEELQSARLMVQTPEITQSRDIVVGECEDLEDLRELFFEEFHSVLKQVRQSQTLLFCLASAESDAEQQMMWFLVTKQSDFARVVRCAAFRLQDKRCNEGDAASYAVAFKEAPGEGRRAKKGKAKGQTLLLGYNPTVEEHHGAAYAHAHGPSGHANGGYGGHDNHDGYDRQSLPGRGRECAAAAAYESPASDADDPPPPVHAAASRSHALNGSNLRTCGYAQYAVPPPPPPAYATAAASPRINKYPPQTAHMAVAHSRQPPPPLPPPPPPPSADSLALTTSALELLSTRLPGCNAVPPAMSAARSQVSTWDEDDGGNSRVSRARMGAIADALLE